MILQVAAGSPWWLFAAANLILFLHIAGGTLGIISGAVALLSRKGGRMHRLAGTVFLVSMLTMATIGAAASPFLPVLCQEKKSAVPRRDIYPGAEVGWAARV